MFSINHGGSGGFDFHQVVVCGFVLLILFLFKGTSWTSSEKVSFLTGTECEQCTERLSITPLARCWTAWRTLSHWRGRRSDKLSSICCPITKVPEVCLPHRLMQKYPFGGPQWDPSELFHELKNNLAAQEKCSFHETVEAQAMLVSSNNFWTESLLPH